MHIISITHNAYSTNIVLHTCSMYSPVCCSWHKRFCLYLNCFRRVSKIRSFQTVDATNTLATFILFRLDYCNSLLAGLSDHKLAKLQRRQNNAAKLILHKPRYESTTPLLKILHWLPVKAQIKYKVSTLCYQCLNSVAMPSCLCELLQTYKPTRTLRSQDSSLVLLVPRFSLNT